MLHFLPCVAHGVSLTAGSHTLGNRPFYVELPKASSSSGRFPVLITLHGNGGTGTPAAKSMYNGNSDIASSHIIIGPDGPSKSWNIKGEASNEDDATYVGKTLVDHLATFDNVDSTSFKLYGFSNGAALTNRILIENDDPRITHGITDCSQLNTFQYRSSNFYIGGPNNDYNTVKAKLTSRRVLQIVGGGDKVIPAGGGASTIPDGDGGKLQMVQWEESALAYAKAFGYTGSKAVLSPDSADQATASYLNGQVVGINLKTVAHVAGPSNELAKAAVKSFLATTGDLSSSVTNPGGSAPSPSAPTGSTACSASCATEFDKCVAFGSNTYAICRSQIESAHTPLMNAGCVAGCTDTASMAVHNPSPNSSSGLSGAAIGGIAAGAAVVALGLAVLAYFRLFKTRSTAETIQAAASETKTTDGDASV